MIDLIRFSFANYRQDWRTIWVVRDGLNPFRRYSCGFLSMPGKRVPTAAVFLPAAQTFVGGIFRFRIRLRADTLQLVQALASCFY